MFKRRGETNKYLNRRVCFDKTTGKFVDPKWAKEHLDKENRIFLDSQLEANTFKILLKTFSLKEIEIHPKIYIGGENNYYPSQYWFCDFRVVLPSARLYHFESKGVVTESFKWQLKFSSNMRPMVFNNLALVVAGKPHEVRKRLGVSYRFPIIELKHLDDYVSKLMKYQS